VGERGKKGEVAETGEEGHRQGKGKGKGMEKGRTKRKSACSTTNMLSRAGSASLQCWIELAVRSRSASSVWSYGRGMVLVFSPSVDKRVLTRYRDLRTLKCTLLYRRTSASRLARLRALGLQPKYCIPLRRDSGGIGRGACSVGSLGCGP
jgi:hypothetical protein